MESFLNTIENLTTTTLRNLIGNATLTSRDTINTKMRVILDVTSDSWGREIK